MRIRNIRHGQQREIGGGDAREAAGLTDGLRPEARERFNGFAAKAGDETEAAA